MKIALIQTDIIPDIRHNLEKAEFFCSSAADQGAEVLVLPELFSTGFPPDKAAELAPEWGPLTRDLLNNISSRKKVHIIAGCGDPLQDGRFFNSALVYDDLGNVKSVYHKINLFKPGNEHVYVKAGDKPAVFQIRNIPASVFICYDLRFPEIYRQIAKRVKIIFQIANWPDKRVAHWKLLLQARAVENQCWVIGVNRVGLDSSGLSYSGDSMIVDPFGDIRCHLSAEAGYHITEIHPSETDTIREKLPFLIDIDSE